MTLWIDVTDLYGWGLGHLTGIQRVSASVLSELMTTRRDVQLFAYDASAQILRKVDVHSLPRVVRQHIDVQGVVTGDVDGRPAVVAARSHMLRDKVVRARLYWGPKLWFLKPAVRRLRSIFQRQREKWGSREVIEAVKDFRRSIRNLLALIWRNSIGRERTAQSIASAPVSPINPDTILFKAGDVCLALSATWGFSRYGDVIAGNLQASGAKCVNMLYDLIPTLFPQWVLAGQSQMITLWARRQIQNADAILTISEFQKQEILRYIETDRLPQRTIEIIHLGDNPRLMVAAQGSLPLPRYIPERKFVICVSTLDVRKNHDLLYRVWQRLIGELGPDCPQLIWIGTPHLLVSDILHQVRNDRAVNRVIVHLPDVSDEELAWYYRNCAFTIYPSIYEGWGLPISESLSLGRYCIAANRASLPEAGGDLVDYFDPFDFVGCYGLVHRATTDPAYVKQCEARIRENYVPYSWAMTAAQVSSVVDRMAGSGGEKVDQCSSAACS